MRLDRYDDHMTMETRFVLTIGAVEWMLARLDGFDLALLRDCDGPDATIADRMLALETIARRIEQAKRPQPAAPQAVLEAPPEEVEAELVE